MVVKRGGRKGEKREKMIEINENFNGYKKEIILENEYKICFHTI